MPYCATPEELACQWETLDEILAVLVLCTLTQRERFLLYCIHEIVIVRFALHSGNHVYQRIHVPALVRALEKIADLIRKIKFHAILPFS